MDPLAEPLLLPCGASVPNRLAKAAMSEGLATSHGLPSEAHVTLYERWAGSGAGLLVTGNVVVDGTHPVARGDVSFDEEAPVFERWARSVTSRGCAFWMQINHPGRQTPRALVAEPVSCSAVRLTRGAVAFATPRALEEPEILGIVSRFAGVAHRAQRAGFTGVQIHAAHGYLISQFLSARTNRRADAWGGSAERRRRFLLEVVRAVRAAVGPRFPVAVKLNSSDLLRGGFDVDESIAVALALEAEGIDLLEISGGTYEVDAVLGRREGAREAYFYEYVASLRPRTKLPMMLTGGMRSASLIRSLVGRGSIDVAGLARPMISCPDLPARILGGLDVPTLEGVRPLGIRATDAAMELAWYGTQLRRLARGAEPDTRASRWSALGRAARAFV
jgi:2,4-dienoyl-CoA reductase-like NADH-dependent reductase (Old Yellow Enzyme family)